MTSSRGTPEVNQDMILGEIRGQLREVVHSVNNLTQKFDGLTREVIGLAVLGTEMAEMKGRMDKMDVDISALKSGHDRYEGATGILAYLMKSPTLAWFIALAVAGFAAAKGWVQVP